MECLPLPPLPSLLPFLSPSLLLSPFFPSSPFPFFSHVRRGGAGRGGVRPPLLRPRWRTLMTSCTPLFPPDTLLTEVFLASLPSHTNLKPSSEYGGRGLTICVAWRARPWRTLPPPFPLVISGQGTNVSHSTPPQTLQTRLRLPPLCFHTSCVFAGGWRCF